MNTGFFYEAVKGLRSAIPASSGNDTDGFKAVIKLNSRLSSDAEGLLRACFSVDVASQNDERLGIVLVDNLSKPILYISETVACSNAANYLKSIEKKFLFHAFRTYNIKLDVPTESIVTFMPRKK